MHLSKPDILQAAMIGLTLVASAIAVPVIASGQEYQPVNKQTVHSTQQLAQDNPAPTLCQHKYPEMVPAQ